MIYCVEDERKIRELIVYTLESSGFHAKGLESGQELMQEMEKLGYEMSKYIPQEIEK